MGEIAKRTGTDFKFNSDDVDNDDSEDLFNLPSLREQLEASQLN